MVVDLLQRQYFTLDKCVHVQGEDDVVDHYRFVSGNYFFVFANCIDVEAEKRIMNWNQDIAMNNVRFLMGTGSVMEADADNVNCERATKEILQLCRTTFPQFVWPECRVLTMTLPFASHVELTEKWCKSTKKDQQEQRLRMLNGSLVLQDFFIAILQQYFIK